MVIYSTSDRDIAFGAEGPSKSHPSTGATIRDLWHGHTNWLAGGTHRAYFDPGYCCNSTGNRSFINPNNSWDQYTFTRRDDPGNSSVDRSIGRLNGVEELNGAIDNAIVLQITNYPMGIGGVIDNSSGTSSKRNTNNRFSEFIMYNSGKEDSFVEQIEENQMIYWNL